jgi:hypothetical protein
LFHRGTSVFFAIWLAAVGVGEAASAPGPPAPADPGRPEGATVAVGTGGGESAPKVDEILARYNAGIQRALDGIVSLSVAQTVFEPQDDGTTKRACAILKYERGGGMVREETFSELTYPVGEYTLSSLVGPLLDPSEYRVQYAGDEEAEGVACHRLEVTAISRDYRHFDGSIWVSVANLGPVRIVGRVADPPFPAREVTLDKVFAEGDHGLWLVRRHTGRGEFHLLFLTKRGERTIYYDDYETVLSEPPAEPRPESE